MLKTSGGRLFMVKSSRLEESRLAPRGCAARRVTVTGRLYSKTAVLDVLDLAPAPGGQAVSAGAERSGSRAP